jgi:hypothetical protein
VEDHMGNPKEAAHCRERASEIITTTP